MDFGKCISHLFNPNFSEYISYFSLAVRNYQDQKQFIEEFIFSLQLQRAKGPWGSIASSSRYGGQAEAECSHPHPKQEAERKNEQKVSWDNKR